MKKTSDIIRKLEIGKGKPKICIPLVSRSLKDLLKEAALLKQIPCDLAEWRADYFDGLEDPDALASALPTIQEALGQIPLLFTIRTRPEGGEIDLSPAAYLRCNQQALESGIPAMADAELTKGNTIMQAMAEIAHGCGAALIGSRHDFHKTPSGAEIIESLCQMNTLGADISKYAVMPQTPRDVLTLLDATLTMKEKYPDIPVVTMSMGKLGGISRITGGIFGSCITFGAARTASAPGQLPARQLDEFLTALQLLSETI